MAREPFRRQVNWLTGLRWSVSWCGAGDAGMQEFKKATSCWCAEDVQEHVWLVQQKKQSPHPKQLHGNAALKLTYVTCVFCAAVT